MTYGVGVLGLGVIGRRLIEGFRANPHFTVVAGYDPSSVDVDVPRAASAQDLIDDPAVDCLYIATPPATHEELVRAVAQAGKVIFCEKPLAATPASARACVKATKEAGVSAAINFPFATAPAAVRLKELVETGALGENLSAHLTLRFKTWPRGWQHGAVGWLAGPEQGGFTREVVSHFMFLAQRLFGPGRLIESQVERGLSGTETRVNATVQFARARLVIDGAVEGDIGDLNRFEVKGSEGSAVMSDWYRLRHADEHIEPARADGGQIAELAKLLAGEPCRLATMEEAAAVVDIIEGILARSQDLP
ncbi:Gfo/Idh/MocA family protein [Microvirga terricola]|uniref:Gfo/Idh/MocA family oxidoreductase n=1 Tax=Microvirga terricola TaxID=2719797 RepID=A0ABX0VAE3_9HYPH|nr:Gfo/Idh/MocA family oxidoreductase [Microvirga terricola]NIX75660.1 Gfo/Idh/MocA family oxidoreductase [Microvirga terricola]